MKLNKIPTKLFVQITAGVLTAALLMGTTYAWHDFTQHKTNDLQGTTKKYDASLIENFKPNNNWTTNGDYGMKPGEVQKQVQVANPGDPATTGPVYVRVSLKEYMDITPIVYTYSDVRCLLFPPAPAGSAAGWQTSVVLPNGATATGTPGHFVTFGTYDAALAAVKSDASLVFPNKDKGPLTDTLTKDSGYFIVTNAAITAANNGVYGKFVCTYAGEGTKVMVAPKAATYPDLTKLGINTVTNSSDNADTLMTNNAAGKDYVDGNLSGVNPSPNPVIPENSWATYYPTLANEYIGAINVGATIGINSDVQTITNSGIRQFVQLNFGPNVMSYSDYVNNGGAAAYPNGVWIYDDTNANDPYFYWSQPLAPGATTDDLLQSVKLITQPNGDFNYGLHVDMQAVSKDQFADWGIFDTNNGVSSDAKLASDGSVIFGDDTTPPPPPVYAPVTIDGVNAGASTAGGKCDTVGDVTVSVNGGPTVAVTNNGGTWSYTSPVQFVAGDTITVTQNGNTASTVVKGVSKYPVTITGTGSLGSKTKSITVTADLAKISSVTGVSIGGGAMLPAVKTAANTWTVSNASVYGVGTQVVVYYVDADGVSTSVAFKVGNSSQAQQNAAISLG